jgi:hypothetical protein
MQDTSSIAGDSGRYVGSLLTWMNRWIAGLRS